MSEREATLDDWVSMIKREYREMPGLQLTKPQVRRMWTLDDAECEAVLGRLQAAEFLRITPRGSYVLADGGPPSGM